MKTKINLIDETIAGCDSIAEAAARCGTQTEMHRTSEKVEYVRDQEVWDGITIFTDRTLTRVDSVESKIKVGLILESQLYDRQAYLNAIRLRDKFDYIFTHESALLCADPGKFKFLAADTVCIDKESMAIHPKEKNIAMTYSSKTSLPGHKLRHAIVNELLPRYEISVDLFGSGSKNPIKMKSQALNPYRFSIEIENNQVKNYFTEKILDCFATGTIPIYWGCPNIDHFFNPDGILTVASDPDLKKALSLANEDFYESRLDAIKENYELAKQYVSMDDTFATNLINEFPELLND